jgi:hypothetical protein
MSENDGWQQIQELISDVESVNGVPIVYSRWGFRIEKIGDKHFLVSNTKDEILEYLKNVESDAANIAAEQFEGLRGYCGISSGMFCVPSAQCGSYCYPMYWGGSHITCQCNG